MLHKVRSADIRLESIPRIDITLNGARIKENRLVNLCHHVTSSKQYYNVKYFASFYHIPARTEDLL